MQLNTSADQQEQFGPSGGHVYDVNLLGFLSFLPDSLKSPETKIGAWLCPPQSEGYPAAFIPADVTRSCYITIPGLVALATPPLAVARYHNSDLVANGDGGVEVIAVSAHSFYRTPPPFAPPWNLLRSQPELPRSSFLLPRSTTHCPKISLALQKPLPPNCAPPCYPVPPSSLPRTYLKTLFQPHLNSIPFIWRRGERKKYNLSDSFFNKGFLNSIKKNLPKEPWQVAREGTDAIRVLLSPLRLLCARGRSAKPLPLFHNIRSLARGRAESEQEGNYSFSSQALEFKLSQPS